MFKARVLLAGLTMAAAATSAHAALTATPAVTSDYDFRGISQSAASPAASLGVDFNTGALHAGTWLSTIEWGPSYKGKMEWDAILDYTFGSDDTVKVNVGVIDYMYPNMTDQNTVEPWITVSKKWFSGSVHYTNDWFTVGKAWYYEANGTFPIGESGFTVGAHVGHSAGDAWKGIEYTDAALSVAKTLGNFTVTAKVVSDSGTRAFDNTYKLNAAKSLAAFGKKNVFSANDRVMLSVSTTLPWAKAE